MKIEQHRAVQDDGTACSFVRTPNQGDELVAPSVLVVHYTAGRSAESSVGWLTNPRAKASAHCVIARNGAITQLVPFDRVAFHAGRSLWNGQAQLNRWSIGIELDNPGPLVRTGQLYRTWFGAAVAADDVFVGRHKHGGPEQGWHVYPTAQLDALVDLASALFDSYPLKEVVGHEDIAPGRKRDPGPAFPMGNFRSLLLGRATERDADNPTAVATAAVNFRSGPSAQSPKLVEAPLPKGTRVEILDRSGPFCHVEVLSEFDGESGQQGWVHGKFLMPA
jgi:N-acetylmuramoyl-L-alanine amidase